MEDWYKAEDGIMYAFLVSLLFLTKPCTGSLQWLMAGQMTISVSNGWKCHSSLVLKRMLIYQNLLYNGHSSHVTLKMISIAMEDNIILFCLPPHTTHCLQPCDVSMFGPLKHAWNKRCDHVFQATGEPLATKDFVSEYMIAWKESFKVDTIKKAWEKSGIDVGDDGLKCIPGIFTEADSAPSHSSSTLLHLPHGFPHLPIPVEEDSI